MNYSVGNKEPFLVRDIRDPQDQTVMMTKRMRSEKRDVDSVVKRT